jgi:serine protease AprX
VAALAAAVVTPSVASSVTSTGAQGSRPSASVVATHVDAEVRRAVLAGPADVLVRVAGDPAAAMQAVAQFGGEVTAVLPIVDGFAASVTQDALAALAGVPGVLEVVLDGEVTLAHTSTNGGNVAADDFYDEVIGADDLRGAGIDGTGVGIAVIDTGVTEVDDLAGRIVGAVDFSADNDNVDQFGHGTFIAGIAAGDGTASDGDVVGVAPGAHIIPVKIAGRNGAADVSHVLAAMQYVVSFKDTYDIGVLNLSLGTDSTQPQSMSPLNYAVERVWDAGIVVVVSGGNHGAEGAGRIPKPADDPLVLTVGATDSNGTRPTGDDTVASYSSRGPSIADGFEKPDIVAPGSHLVSLRAPGSLMDQSHPDGNVGADYAQGSGTSFAAAVTSGAVALLRQAHPDWDPDQIKQAITSSARPGPVGDRNVDGHGALDVAAAAAASPAPGNQGLIVRSSGLGSLALDRGSLEIEISTSGLFNSIDYLLGNVLRLTGETTAQNMTFSAVEYTTSDWTGSNWYGSNWYGSNWYGSNWYGSNWYGSNWYGSNWYGSNWYGSNWYGSNWYGSNWY